MKRLYELLEKKFLKDRELLELEDDEHVVECKLVKPHNAHYNEYLIVIRNEDNIEKHTVYLKHR